MKLRTTNLKKPTEPALTVYYWLDGDWTLDEAEADEVSEGLFQDSLHGIAYFKPDTSEATIDRAIKSLAQDQPQSHGAVMLQAKNKWFL